MIKSPDDEYSDGLEETITTLRKRVVELEKERDEEIARNRPLRNLIASLEDQKLHWNKQRDEYREAVATLDSERAANAKLTAERDELLLYKNIANEYGLSVFEDMAALKQQRDELLEANRIACEDLVERHDRIAELKQQRDEIERERNYILLNAEVAMKCIGDMGPSKPAVKAYSILQEAIASVKEK